MAHETPVHRYAILIGINAYEKPLKGCVNDVQKIEEALQKSVEPYDTHIQTLTATPSPSTNSSPSPCIESGQDLPTYSNVTEAIRNARTRAQQGDHIYIHYSGHGTRKPPDENPDNSHTNRHTGDLALALLDESNLSKVAPLSGPMFAKLLNGIIKKDAVLTVVLDCCFSGSAYREAIRYLPWSANFTPERMDFDDTEEKEVAKPLILRDLSMIPSLMLNPSKYSLLAACGPTQSAAEIRIKQRIHGRTIDIVHGKLSYHLCDIFVKYGLQQQLIDMYHHLMVMFHFGETHTDQAPILSGNKMQGFFGAQTHGARSTQSWGNIAVDNSTAGKMKLLAGNAHGMVKGDVVRLHLSALNRDITEIKEASPILAKLSDVDALVSWLVPEDSTETLPVSHNWTAEPVKRQCLVDYPVSLSPNLQTSEWKAALEGQALTVHEKSSSKPFCFHVKLNFDDKQQNAVYQILNSEESMIPSLPPMVESDTEVQHVAALLSHLVKYELVKNLGNPRMSPDSMDCQKQVQHSVEAYIKTEDEAVYKSDQLIRIRHKQSFKILLKNNSSLPLYGYVYSLGPLFQVEHVQCASFDMMRPAGDASFGPNSDFSPTLSKKLEATIPKELRSKGVTECEDTIKIIVTSHPTSFSLLEMPSIWHLKKRKSRLRHEQDQSSEDKKTRQWAAFNFTIRTTLEPVTKSQDT